MSNQSHHKFDLAESADFQDGSTLVFIDTEATKRGERRQSKELKFLFPNFFFHFGQQEERGRSIELPSGESFILTVESGIHKEEMKMGLPTEGVTNQNNEGKEHIRHTEKTSSSSGAKRSFLFSPPSSSTFLRNQAAKMGEV